MVLAHLGSNVAFVTKILELAQCWLRVGSVLGQCWVNVGSYEDHNGPKRWHSGCWVMNWMLVLVMMGIEHDQLTQLKRYPNTPPNTPQTQPKQYKWIKFML